MSELFCYPEIKSRKKAAGEDSSHHRVRQAPLHAIPSPSPPRLWAPAQHLAIPPLPGVRTPYHCRARSRHLTSHLPAVPRSASSGQTQSTTSRLPTCDPSASYSPDCLVSTLSGPSTTSGCPVPETGETPEQKYPQSSAPAVDPPPGGRSGEWRPQKGTPQGRRLPRPRRCQEAANDRS